MREESTPEGISEAGAPGAPAVMGFERFTASLIVVSGEASGEEHVVDGERWLLGRGPGVDVAFDDPKMSRQHALIAFSRGRFHATDLDSTNGTRVNGTGIATSELIHGDRIAIGGHVFQILIEERGAVSGYALPGETAAGPLS